MFSLHRTARMLFTLSLLIVASCFLTFDARADNVSLTSGTVSRFINDVNINISGPSFSMIYIGDQNGLPNRFSINTAFFGSGMPLLSYNGVQTGNFRGGGIFTDSLLTGSVTAYATNDFFFEGPALFTLNFTGNGFTTINLDNGVRLTTFNVGAVQTPEPATLLLLGTGLTGISAFARRRHKSVKTEDE